MSKTTVIEIENGNIQIDDNEDIPNMIMLTVPNKHNFLNREQTKQLIEHLQSTLEDEESNKG